jgi:7-cyano-7-deazaguanine synthase
MKKENVVISLSGGLDSSTLLLRCLLEYKNVVCISFDYGQKHRIELQRAQELVDYINSQEAPLEDGVRPYVTYQQIKLEGLVDLLESTLTSGGGDVPEGHYAEENMRATVVPNRNKIFSSIIQAVALSIAGKTGEKCDIALGIHSGDHAVYPDTTEKFRQADLHAFKVGNWGSDKVEFFTPYMEGDKFTILRDGETLCGGLGLDFNEVYSRTNTSYKPYPSGNSDYKSSSSIERIEAFIKLGRPDPIIYEDETGIVSWEIAKSYAKLVLEEYNNQLKKPKGL